jgi:hypothetical protein
MAQAVEHLSSKCKALNSTPSATKKIKKTWSCRSTLIENQKIRTVNMLTEKNRLCKSVRYNIIVQITVAGRRRSFCWFNCFSFCSFCVCARACVHMGALRTRDWTQGLVFAKHTLCPGLLLLLLPHLSTTATHHTCKGLTTPSNVPGPVILADGAGLRDKGETGKPTNSG